MRIHQFHGIFARFSHVLETTFFSRSTFHSFGILAGKMVAITSTIRNGSQRGLNGFRRSNILSSTCFCLSPRSSYLFVWPWRLFSSSNLLILKYQADALTFVLNWLFHFAAYSAGSSLLQPSTLPHHQFFTVFGEQSVSPPSLSATSNCLHRGSCRTCSACCERCGSAPHAQAVKGFFKRQCCFLLATLFHCTFHTLYLYCRMSRALNPPRCCLFPTQYYAGTSKSAPNSAHLH